MRFGVMLPYVTHTTRERFIAWCRRADESDAFNSVSIGERVGFLNIDQVVALSVAAACTERVRLLTHVTILPIHPPALFAKQMASIDLLSAGRLIITAGVGVRPQDFELAGTTIRGRYERLEAMVPEMQRIWRGEPATAGVTVGPRPVTDGGPRFYVGGSGQRILRLSAEWASGYVGFTLDGALPALEEEAQRVRAAWGDVPGYEERELMTSCFVCLDDNAAELFRSRLGAYFAYEEKTPGIWPRVDDGPRTEEFLRRLTVTSTERLGEVVRNVATAGYSELTLIPVTDDLTEFDRLEAAVHSL